jgi:hypothetical protein
MIDIRLLAAADRDAVPQWVLPLVIRIERVDPPTRTDALEAAARAVLTLLADPRSREAPSADPPAEAEAASWADAVRAWEAGRIRKVVRRARGAEWRRAAALPGITVQHHTAEVRVFPPVPLNGWPPELSRLQVSGTDLADPAEPGPPPHGVPVIWLSPEPPITAGKAMAQVGHAAQLAWWELEPAARAGWVAAGLPLAVRVADPAKWRALLAGGWPVVRDGGFTEVEPGTATAVAEFA